MLYSRKCFLLLLAALLLSASLPAAAAPKTILVLGDSLAAGYGVDPDQAWPALLQKKIDAAGLRFKVLNAGVSGDTTADGLQRVDWLLRRKADVLLLELGGNDGLRGLPLDSTRTNLQAIIDRFRQNIPAIQIVIAGMKMPPNMGPGYVDAFDKIYPELAAKNHAELIPFLLEGVGGKPDLNLSDGIHPTPEGHKIVAENVWAVLRPLLQ
ncbi:MAG: arylesterase [Verrucomicrobiota bacterium]|jgi:acyl-CoA thioesterase-1